MPAAPYDFCPSSTRTRKGLSVSKHLKFGRQGEDLAADFLVKQGLKILKRNVRTPFGELDLICLDGDVVVFVEVKTRSGNEFGGPRAAVGKEKRRRISKSAVTFLGQKNWQDRRARFDILGIVHDGTTPEFDHLVDAFDLALI
jgi:putative endonuclease